MSSEDAGARRGTMGCSPHMRFQDFSPAPRLGARHRLRREEGAPAPLVTTFGPFENVPLIGSRSHPKMGCLPDWPSAFGSSPRQPVCPADGATAIARALVGSPHKSDAVC